jgi:DNA-binding NtrC family response regulator
MEPKSILLIDDEEMVRDIGKAMLARLGHRVSIAADGKEALALMAAQTPPFDLVIFDMRMPGMTGAELLAQMQAASPGSRVILSSGYALNEEASQLMAKGCCGFIHKPFRLADITAAVEAAFTS